MEAPDQKIAVQQTAYSLSGQFTVVLPEDLPQHLHCHCQQIDNSRQHLPLADESASTAPLAAAASAA